MLQVISFIHHYNSTALLHNEHLICTLSNRDKSKIIFVQLPSRYILPSSVAHTSIAIEIAVAIERCYVVTYIFHGRYVLWIVGVIGVKVTVFLKTYVNVSYRARSAGTVEFTPAAVYRWLTVQVSPVLP